MNDTLRFFNPNHSNSTSTDTTLTINGVSGPQIQSAIKSIVLCIHVITLEIIIFTTAVWLWTVDTRKKSSQEVQNEASASKDEVQS
ncbi:MAG: hypothetical protein SFY92_00645 [Verrucomicrobiae bacterium]|nr:hypothetical protein [Verrucomicrobiae bacterium]